MQVQNYATYTFNIKTKHDFTALLGHEFIDYKGVLEKHNVSGFENVKVALGNEQDAVKTYIPTPRSWFLESFFGRLNYGFSDKYLVEVNLRADRSSRFNDSKFAFFPSYSAAWRISEEKFLKNNALISNLKLRASYGLLGNDKVGDFTTKQFYDTNDKYPTSNPNQPQDVSFVKSLPNENIKWEQSIITNIGLDFSFFKNKFNASIDYFNKNTEGILIRLPSSSSLGDIQKSNENAGVVNNKGWDIEASYKTAIKKLNISVSGNISTVVNKVISLANAEFTSNDRYITREGIAIRSFYGYQTNGLHLDNTTLGEPALLNNPNILGQLRLKDQNSDGMIDSKDKVALGSSFPDFSYGFSTRLNFKGIDFSAFFQGIAGKSIYNFENGNRPSGKQDSNFWPKWATESVWQPGNLTATLPDLRSSSAINIETSDFWIDDASYLRLKNVELGFSLPQKISGKLKMSKLRFYANAQNILTITNIKNIDPEKLASDTQSNSYPQTKTVTLGLNATF